MNPNNESPNPELDENTLAHRLGRWWQSLNKPMRGIAVLAIVLGLFLMVGALYTTLNPSKEQLPTDTTVQAPPTAQIKISKSGLSPQTITISAGTVLTWTNSDNKPHQPAADPHPLNNSIDGFDGDILLQEGDSLSFTFETPGTYSIHDHLNPLNAKFQGTVVVE